MAEKKPKNTDETVEETTAEETPAEETPVAEEKPKRSRAKKAEPVAEEAAAPEVAADEAPVEEPVAEVEPVAEEAPAPEEPPAPVLQSGPKAKRKRLPRALRPQKTRPTRERAATRKPIVRLEKPEHERGRSQERRGVVVSDAMDKTIVVKVDTIKAHPKYKKVVRRSIKFHAHDEQNSAKVGDVVRIVETRPVSKTKRWRLAEVVEVAK